MIGGTMLNLIRIKNQKKLALLGVFTILAYSFSSLAQSAPEKAEITGVQVQGSGCDASNTSITLSPDLKDMSVLFDNYSVEIGLGSAAGIVNGLQKNCQILVDISIPRGWQYAFKAVDYRGFVALPASAWAFHRFTTIVPNAPIVTAKEVTHNGPLNGNYTYHTEVKPGRETYSPCNQTQQRITLLSQMAVNFFPRTTDRSNAILALDSADTSFKQDLTIVWRQCSGTPSPQPPGGPRPGPGTGPIRPQPRPPGIL